MIPDLCSCGSGLAPIAFCPGDAPEISEASDILITRGRPVTCRCLVCWPAKLNFQQELFAQ